MKLKIYVVGHSHIDAVWLWDRKETVEICCYKTFTNAIDLLKKYPNLIFAQSSAQFYEWIEKYYPEVFEEIKKLVSEGKWEILGGMWVESDCNIPSGESLVRQILYGKKYFKEKFNFDVKVVWLPDTFGFASTLPQIFKKSGIEYFVTSKLNWQTTLPFPYFLFRWKSIDGSEIIGYETPGGYNNTDPEHLIRQAKFIFGRHKIKASIFPYGKGDHGGGFTEEMLKKLFEYKNDEIEKIDFIKAHRYFEEKIDPIKDKLPEFKDELYLKTHRGTYTSFAKIKLNNRRAEIALDIAERFSTIANSLGMNFKVEEFEEIWKILLLNQFHDSIAGTSIEKVYKDSEEDFKKIFDFTNSVIQKSLDYILRKNNVGTTGTGKSLFVFNPLSWQRNNVVKVELEKIGFSNFAIKDSEGNLLDYQIVTENGKRYVEFLAKNVPSVGYKVYRIVEWVNQENKEASNDLLDNKVIENEFFKIEVGDTGVIKSIYDKKREREVLGEKGGNIIQIYEDETLIEGPWNIWLGKLDELHEPVSILKEENKLSSSITVKYKYKDQSEKDSTFTLKISLYKSIPLIFFKTDIDWHEKHKMIKVGFHFNGYNDFTTYEVPYGHIVRRNPDSKDASPAERAKWEVSGQKWLDYTFTDGKYGVSLLNDSKYGFDVHGNFVRMSLLRTPSFPLPYYNISLEELENLTESVMDLGKHTINYALYPHIGDWREAGTFKKAYEFNYPLIPVFAETPEGCLPQEISFLGLCGSDSILLMTWKKSEDKKGEILRLLETEGKEQILEIEISDNIKEAYEVNLMEEILRSENITIDGRKLRTNIKPYEIKTIKIVREKIENSLEN
ncbi:alpha-mannosidase [Caldicoprobacter guelmensis]|uniref:alpha-mannosidase n=1 Tax=Caldicoprobacter guelmensis TaxID=1170224 RepID=UPI0019565DC8|nr:glycoside hydrolase family 38 C-terminal domain-containing protein [Caldicoprobacter guelmensis]MBM7583353.1 alpha-mannosidase [Caldicoprobacter guelmensis]